MNKYYLFGCFILYLLLFSLTAPAQTKETDGSIVSHTAVHATQIYSQRLSRQLLLYNGVEYIPGTEGYVKGHPYLETDVVEEGSITYNNITYTNVPLLYDIYKNEIITEHLTNAQKIKLHSERIQSFSLLGHTFVRLQSDTLSNADISSGFYDRLYTGSVNVYARRSKIVQQATRGVSKEFLSKNSYFISKDHVLYPVKKQSAVLKVFQDQKKALQNFLKENKINFGQDPEYALIRLAEHYSYLVKHL